jgi:hypothetical protein
MGNLESVGDFIEHVKAHPVVFVSVLGIMVVVAINLLNATRHAKIRVIPGGSVTASEDRTGFVFWYVFYLGLICLCGFLLYEVAAGNLPDHPLIANAPN